MIHDNNGIGELGWGLKSLAKGVAKGVASGAKGAAKGVSKGVRTTASATKMVGKAAVKTAMVPVKVVGKISKAAFNLVTKPIRSRLGTIKNRRAALLAKQAGRSAPTAADHAKARSDTKSMLSSQGVHGKMLAYLAGGTDDNILMGEFGAAGVDDVAIAAAATALTALAAKLVTSAAKSGFAPIASKVAAGTALVTKAQNYATTAQNYAAKVPTSASAAKAAVAQEAAQEAEAVQQEVETVAEEQVQEQVDAAMEGTGCFFGSADAVMIGYNPASMRPRAARKIAKGTHKMMMQLTPEQLNRIGGRPAMRTGWAYKKAVKRGDTVTAKRLRPGATQIAARVAAATQKQAAVRAFGVAEVPPPQTFGLDAETITLLGALDGAYSQELAYGLAGADTGALDGVFSDPTKLALIPMGVAVLAGVWMAFHD